MRLRVAELDAVVEIAIVARIPDFHRAPVARRGLAHAHAFGVESLVAERRSARGADPLVAALVPFLLFAQALAQRLEQFVPATERFDAAFLFFGEQLLGELLQPFGR